jgi:hypothetical protein
MPAIHISWQEQRGKMSGIIVVCMLGSQLNCIPEKTIVSGEKNKKDYDCPAKIQTESILNFHGNHFPKNFELLNKTL